MDPVKQIVNPVAEVRRHASRFIDEFGEEWAVIDGIETKIPRIAAAKELLTRQDALRVQIRADLDEKGLRYNPDGTDREEQVEITLDDGTVTTVGLVKPGDANYMQIGGFPDAEGLFVNAAKAQAKADTEAALVERARKRAALAEMAARRSPFVKIWDFLRKGTK